MSTDEAAAAEQAAGTFREVFQTALVAGVVGAGGAFRDAFSAPVEETAGKLKRGLQTALGDAFRDASVGAWDVLGASMRSAFAAASPVLKTALGDALKDAATGGEDTGKVLAKGLSAGMTAGLSGFADRAGLGGIVDQMIAVGKDFDGSLEQIKSASKATDDQMSQVSETARRLGGDLPSASAKDAASAMAELAKSGFRVDQSMAAATGTLQLAGAAHLGAAQAADLEAKVLQSYGKNADYAATAADVLASSAKLMGVNVNDVAGGLVASSADATKLGLSMADTASAMAVLAQSGVPASQAGDMLASAFRGLTSGSAPAQTAIEQLGLSLTGVDGKFVGLPTLFDQLHSASQRMAPGMYEMATSALFGSDAVKLAAVAAQQGASAFDSVSAAIAQQGVAADLAAQNTNVITRSFKMFEDASVLVAVGIDVVSKAIADLIINGFGKLTEIGVGIIAFYREWADIINSVGVAIGAFFLPLLVKLGIEYAVLAARMLTTTSAQIANAVATNAVAIAQNIAAIATRAWAIAIAIFEAATAPLGAVITIVGAIAAGLIYFFTQTDTGKQLWETIWESIKSAVVAAWEYIKPVWGGFLDAMNSVGDALTSLWSNIIQPVLGLAGDLISVWWNGLVKPVWDGFVEALQLVGDAIGFWWNNIAQPMLGLAGDLISVWWNGLVKPVWDGFVEALQLVGDAIGFWWNNIAQPMLGLAGDLISVWWNGLVKPVWDGFVWAVQGVGTVISWLWTDVVQPTIGFIGDSISNIWNGIIKPVWDAFIAALQLVGITFQAMWDQFIKPAWETFQAGFQAGWEIIRIAIETGKGWFDGLCDKVINAVNTILDYWNKIKDIVGTVVDTVGKIPGIGTAVNFLTGHATGGYISGPGSGTSDSILARLSDGEFVVNAKATTEHLPLLQAINSGALPAYAQGGLVTADQLVEFAKGVEGAVYNWGGVNWGDCSGAISALANFVAGLPPFGSRFATVDEGEGLVARGFQYGVGPIGSLQVGWYNGGQFGGHTAATPPNGVNFEMGGQRGNGQYGGMAVGANDPMFTDHAFFQFAAAQMASPTGIEPSPNPTPANSAPVGGPTDNRSPMVKRQDQIFDSITSNFQRAGDAFAQGMFGDFLKVVGAPDPKSSGLWQARAAWEKSSQQFIKDSAAHAQWEQTRDRMPPSDDTSIWWDPNRGPEQLLDLPGRVANALLSRIAPTRYDDGGWLPTGLTLVENKTGRPEPVFNAQQWAQMSDLAEGSGSTDNSINIENLHTGMTAEDLRHELNLIQKERSLGFVRR
ncbi:phage tail tape measure protein [Nocardia arthritidis]|nr:phage tail tape measure protein [Nocardia arthritidis]